MTKHDFIAEKIAAGWSDADIILSSTRWKIKPADIAWNRKHHNGGLNGTGAYVPGWEFPDDDPGFPQEPVDKESPAERSERISRQYQTLERMAKRIIAGQLPSLIVSGPPGLGKTYTVENELERANVDADIIRGAVSPVGLYMALWNASEKGVVILDDCDSVFDDVTSLNLLKVALDTSTKRIVSWRKKRSSYFEEHDIPDSFEFEGSVVFCTNIDFEREIDRGSKMSPHYKALVDRSLYVALPLWGREDVLTRIEQVVLDGGEYEKLGLTRFDAEDTMEFVREHSARFYTLSIRSALQVAKCRLMDPENWRDDAQATLLRLRKR